MQSRMPLATSAMLLMLVSASAHGQTGKAAIPTTPSLDDVNKMEKCREYLPTKDEPCRIDFDMAQTSDGKFPPQVHKDIAVWPGPNGQAVVVLRHSSPFAACVLTTSPGPLGRDLSANIGTLLSLLGTFGAPAPAVAVEQETAGVPLARTPPTKSIDAWKVQINAEVLLLEVSIDPSRGDLQGDLEDLKTIKEKLHYSYTDDQISKEAVQAIYAAVSDFVARPLPDSKTLVPNLHKQIVRIEGDLNTFQAEYPAHDYPDVALYVDGIRHGQIKDGKSTISELTYLGDMTSKVTAILDFLATLSVPGTVGEFPEKNYSTVILPIAIYPESKVGVSVKCADAVTNAPLFDTIQFNAYYQVPPTFDISAGVLVSFLKGRQVGTEALPHGNANASTMMQLAVTSRSRVQFMPATFVEWHWKNFKLPGVKDPGLDDTRAPLPTWMSLHAPRHPLGYVGSFGLAGGFLVNPNNGTGEAEFFEGLSLGIQRFSIVFGNHTGRSQNFTDGYAVGQTVMSGVVPPTVRNWGNGLAVGIAYRIALR